MDIVRIYASILKIAFALAAVGQLKACTLTMMGMAAEHHEMISYSKFTKALFSADQPRHRH
jgi:hypothetical protein